MFFLVQNNLLVATNDFNFLYVKFVSSLLNIIFYLKKYLKYQEQIIGALFNLVVKLWPAVYRASIVDKYITFCFDLTIILLLRVDLKLPYIWLRLSTPKSAYLFKIEAIAPSEALGEDVIIIPDMPTSYNLQPSMKSHGLMEKKKNIITKFANNS